MSRPFFPPPHPPAQPGVLARWAAPIAPAWATETIQAATQPGDLVVDPFCQGAVVAATALRLGRSVVIADFNPVQTLAARAAIVPPDPQTVSRVITRLADTLKVDQPLREALLNLYTTRCPHCGAATPAKAFTWDAAAGVPTRKFLTCRACGWDGVAVADGDDLARALELEPLSLSYWWLVERLADVNDSLRPLAERLAHLYAPRAQRALADLLRATDDVGLGPEEGEAARMVLLGCLDACSKLNTVEWDRSVPRRLDPPRRYVELNVWSALEAVAVALRDAPTLPAAEWVAEPGQVLTDMALPYAYAGRLPTRALADAIAGRARLAMGAPPRFSPVFWTLSWAWASWLWSRRAASPLRGLVERYAGRLLAPPEQVWRAAAPGVDWDWYVEALAATLASLRGALAGEGRLGLAWTGEREAWAAVVAGATAAGYRLEGIATRSPRAGAYWLDAQAVFVRQAERPARRAPSERPAVGMALEEVAAVTAVRLLGEQGEPLAEGSLMPAALAEAARSGVLERALGLVETLPRGLDLTLGKLTDGLSQTGANTLTRLDDGRLWLRSAEGVALPLADRLERAVIEMLARATRGAPGGAEAARSEEREATALTTEAVYAAFPGLLAPDAELVSACLEAHAQAVAPDVWAAEPTFEPLKLAVSDLGRIGEALGYSVQFPMPWSIDTSTALHPAEVVWLAGGRPVYRFVLQASALIAPHLAGAPSDLPHVLALPERMARLARLKLHRAPDLVQGLAEAGWELLVAERLHRWATIPGVDSEAWRDAAGLDERRAGDGQLRLFEG